MSTSAGTLSAAIIAGLIVVFMKVYDHYHHQSIREYKDILDIQKNIPDSDTEEKEKIKEIVSQKSNAFFENQGLKKYRRQQRVLVPRSGLLYTGIRSVISIFIFCFSNHFLYFILCRLDR